MPKILTGAFGYVSQAIRCDIMDSRASYPLRHLLVHDKKPVMMASNSVFLGDVNSVFSKIVSNPIQKDHGVSLMA